MKITRQGKYNGNQTILVKDLEELRKVLVDIVPENTKVISNLKMYSGVVNKGKEPIIGNFNFNISSNNRLRYWEVVVHNHYDGEHKYKVRMRSDESTAVYVLQKHYEEILNNLGYVITSSLEPEMKSILRTYLKALSRLFTRHFYVVRQDLKYLSLTLSELGYIKHLDIIKQSNGWTDPISILEKIVEEYGELKISGMGKVHFTKYHNAFERKRIATYDELKTKVESNIDEMKDFWENSPKSPTYEEVITMKGRCSKFIDICFNLRKVLVSSIRDFAAEIYLSKGLAKFRYIVHGELDINQSEKYLNLYHDLNMLVENAQAHIESKLFTLKILLNTIPGGTPTPVYKKP